MPTILKSFSVRANSFLLLLVCGPKLHERHPERREGSPELAEILRHNSKP